VLLMGALPFPPTRVMFFTGKGGVGKTSLACATAVALADSGRRVLLVSTDPASNLDEVLGVTLSSRPTPVPGVPGLSALNINPDIAAQDYRERVVGPYRSLLPASAVARMEEQLSGACTVEIAAFDEFTTLLADARTSTDFDHVIFDTAPTGHTLRLLKLPAAWTGFIDTNTTGTSCLGPLAGLQGKVDVYRNSLTALGDVEATTVVLVARADRSALAEAARTSVELATLGITNQRLVVNGVFAARDRQDRVACAFEARGREALSQMPEALARLPRADVPLYPFALIGANGLRRALTGATSASAVTGGNSFVHPDPLHTLIDDLERPGRGVILTMGKGGVGKTTTAAAIAVELAARGHEVLLSTTRSGRARCRGDRWRGGALADLANRSRSGNARVQRGSRLGGGAHAGRSPARPARRGSAIALHRRDRRLPRLRPSGRPGRGRVRDSRYGADRSHAPAARRGRGVPPRSITHAGRGSGKRATATPEVARSRVHEGAARHIA
jgi:arsenite/tail-anchored protein-transporting ATPase